MTCKLYFDWLPPLAAPCYDVDVNYFYYDPKKESWLQAEKASSIKPPLITESISSRN